MPTIQITPETLRPQACPVRSYKTQQEQVIARLRSVVRSLNDSWKGEAQDAFVSKFQSMDSTYRKFAETLESYAKLMETAANEFANEDQRLKSLIQRV